MRGIYDGYNDVETNGKITYFAGGNTENGFASSYGEIADETTLDRIYVIKGGPGTGKSTLMKRVAGAAENEGYCVEYYLCGSDMTSLDCIVIDGRIAMLDGTSPHVRDMIYPGAKSELVDISSYWDKKALEAQKDRIVNCSALKSAEYASAYRYLKAVASVEADMIAASGKIFNREKALGYIKRFIKSIGKPRKDSSSVTNRYTHGVTMIGAGKVNTICDMGCVRIAVNDTFGASVHFMKLLKDALESAGYSITVGYIPVSGHISGIYIKDADVSITVGERRDGDKTINMTRFILDEEARHYKGRIRLAAKCREECMIEALSSLSRASVHHFALEEIYRPTMDFESLEKQMKKLGEEIPVRLSNTR